LYSKEGESEYESLVQGVVLLEDSAHVEEVTLRSNSREGMGGFRSPASSLLVVLLVLLWLRIIVDVVIVAVVRI
jgi:hypothetical protein